MCFIRQVTERGIPRGGNSMSKGKEGHASAFRGLHSLHGNHLLYRSSVTYFHTRLSSHHCKFSELGSSTQFPESVSPNNTCFLLFHPSQSVSPSRPLPSLTTWAGQPESCPSRRGHPCCSTSGLPTTGGKAGTMASTDSSPISTSWSKTRTLGPLHL